MAISSISTASFGPISTRLRVLGNGLQRKSYLHVEDCVAAILTAVEKFDGKYAVFNLGTDAYCEVNNSISWIASELGAEPARHYTGGDRGWVGDNPFIFLDCGRIRTLGWRPAYTIEQGVRCTLTWLRANPWVLDQRL